MNLPEESFPVEKVELKEYIRYTDGSVSYRNEDWSVEVRLPARLVEQSKELYEITFIPLDVPTGAVS